MPQIATNHSSDLGHHVQQAYGWLEQSSSGSNTAALSYAALELRYAIERLAVHYWYALLKRPLEEHDLRDISSFKNLERKIYELGGHQKEIDAHFEFMRIFFSALKIEAPIHTPQISKLSSYWHVCSEVCHIGWPLGLTTSGIADATFARLTEVVETLKEHVKSLGWPILHDERFIKLKENFILGTVTANDVYVQMQKIGIWAKVEYPDGRPSHFIGEAIPRDNP
jgi:hypothetical protein